MDVFKLKNGASFPYLLSRSNAEVVACSGLKEKKFRDGSGLFLCEGEKLFSEAVEHGAPEKIFFCAELAERLSPRTVELFSDPRAAGRVYALSTPAFEKISTEKAPQGIVCSARFPSGFGKGAEAAARRLHSGERTVVLDEVRDPGNVGTVLRTAAAFGFRGAILVSCADPFGPRATRASMGAVFKLGIAAVDTAGEIRDAAATCGRRLVAADLKDDSLTLGADPILRDDVPVIGNEGHGISGDMRALCGASVRIPMAENTESLNAAAAAAVLLWEYSKVSKEQ